MFWVRDEVFWRPGQGPNKWQLLGRQNKNQGSLRVCATSARPRACTCCSTTTVLPTSGLREGSRGLGPKRLKAHHADESKSWSRFCWFSFDDVRDTKAQGWSTVIGRDAVKSAGAEGMVRELEALLIKAWWSRQQNQMQFLQGRPWEQVTLADCQPGGVLTKVDRSPVLQPEFAQALIELN